MDAIEATLDMAKAQQRALLLRLHRINMQASGLEVKSPVKGMSEQSDSFSNQPNSGGGTYGFFGVGRKKPQSGGSGSYMV
jgi:hypothetical protein